MFRKIFELFSFIKGNKILYIGAILAVALATVFSYAIPQVIRITIDSIIGNNPLQTPLWIDNIIEKLGGTESIRNQLWLPGAVIVILTLFQGVFTYLKGRWAAQASEQSIKKLRDQLYNHLQHLPFSFHSESKTGDLIQRCTSDVETIRRFFAMQFVEIGRALIMLLIVIPIMISLNVKMTIISMILVPIIFIFAIIFFIKVKAAFKMSDEAEGELSTVLQENLSGIRVVKAFARQKYEINKFQGKNMNYRNLTYRLIILLAWYWSVSDFLCLTQIALVLVTGAMMAAQNQISLGTLVVFTTYVGLLLWPVRQMGRVLTDMGKAFVSVERIKMILNTHVESRILIDKLNPDLLLPSYLNIHGDREAKLIKIEGNIHFDQVGFHYLSGHKILSNISFKVKPGQTVAILGPTGSGKSSLVNLIPRLYDYSSGSITVDGVELKDIDRYWIRNQISIILQEPFLYSKTITDNLKMGKEHCKEYEIQDATQTAAIHDVITEFDQGYQTLVGEKGVTLSGGQKQRVAIARAILKNSPLLIFDDSFSAVDTETDLRIRNALNKKLGKTTTFIIAHRLTTLAQADLILVMEKGEIVQSGNHHQLINQSGLYQRIWEIQNDLEDDIQAEMDNPPMDKPLNKSWQGAQRGI
ncbi:MAG: ABC transporter [Desulfuromonas sp. SDB]|nr:MAG: ABC transporter [Desulfuromonas sp. SDB]